MSLSLREPDELSSDEMTNSGSEESTKFHGGALYSPGYISDARDLTRRASPDDATVDGLAVASQTYSTALVHRGHEPVKRSVPRYFFRSRIRPNAFQALQKWEGMVVEVSSGSFTARLTDETREGPEEEAEFEWADVSAEDRKLVEPGAIFYWTIGFYSMADGQVLRSSLLRFRRLPAWTNSELKRAQLNAATLMNELGKSDHE